MMTLYTYYKFASTQPPSDSLSPLSPYQPPRALIYIGDISHFLNIFNTLSQLVHHSCTTPPKQYCEVISIHAYIPLLKRVYNYSSSPNSPLHWFYFNTRVLKVLYFHPFIVILICLPALKHLNIQKIFFMDRIVLPKYCFSIAKVVVTSFTKLVHIYYPKWLGECSSLRTQRCKNNLVRRWNCKPSSFTRVTSCESYGSSLLL